MQQQNDDRFQLSRTLEHLLREAGNAEGRSGGSSENAAISEAEPALRELAAARDDESIEIPDAVLSDVQLFVREGDSPLFGQDGDALRGAAEHLLERVRRWE